MTAFIFSPCVRFLLTSPDRQKTIFLILIFLLSAVRPAPPSNLTLRPGRRSLNIDFKISVELTHFPPGLNVSIRYRSEFDDGDWTDMDTSYFDPHQEWYSVTLADLFSYTEYDVEVRLLSTTVSDNLSGLILLRTDQASLRRPTPVIPPFGLSLLKGLRELSQWYRKDHPQLLRGALS